MAGDLHDTATTLTSSHNPSSSDARITFTATVSASDSPIGTVQFKDGTTDLGAAVTCATAGQRDLQRRC